MNDCDNAAGVDTTANDIPETPISSSWLLESPELVFPPDVIQSVCVLERVPRASRHLAATKLARILEDASEKNDSGSWCRLFMFSHRCLAVQWCGGQRRNLASAVNAQLQEEAEPPSNPSPHSRFKSHPPIGQADGDFSSLAKRVSSKLEDGDYRGAVRIACSEDAIAELSDETVSSLRRKPCAASRVCFCLTPKS